LKALQTSPVLHLTGVAWQRLMAKQRLQQIVHLDQGTMDEALCEQVLQA
jgi:hypothetical protein